MNMFNDGICLSETSKTTLQSIHPDYLDHFHLKNRHQNLFLQVAN